MRPPPPISALPRYPIVGGIALLAVGVTIAWKNHVDVSALFESPRVGHGEPWRLVTSALPHIDFFHLAFNCYWLWVLGTLVEETFGHLRTFGLVLLLAVGSGAAEYAFLEGGVGLSGVGYGLFAMLWVLSRYDRRFEDAVDQQTTLLFVGWFFFCILLTATKVMGIANIAHGVGALLGALVGAVVAFPRWRWATISALAVMVAASCLGATVGRPYINVSPDRGHDEAWLAQEAYEGHRDEEAVQWYRRAVASRPDQASWWYNLGLAYQRLGRRAEAIDAFRHACQLAPDNKQMREALEAIERPG